MFLGRILVHLIKITYFCQLTTLELMLMETQHMDVMLLKRLKSGDSTAFDVLFRRYYPMLCAYACRFVSLESAEEIAQDALLWLWEHREDEIIQYSLSKYLLKSVYHRALNRLEQEQMQLNADTRFYQDLVENVLEEEDLCQLHELTARLGEAISHLPESYREAFLKHRLKGMTYKEIADELDVSVQTVNYRIGQALKLLAQELKDYLPLLLYLLHVP